MNSIATLACGNCVYYAMWHKFPPTASWVLIIPVWFLALSIIRTWTDKKFSGIPRVYVAIPLVLAVFFLAPGIIGPPLGFWIPACCLIGTWTGLRSTWKTSLAKIILTVTALAGVSLLAFGAYNYRQYNQMSAAEKEKFLPVWEVIDKRKENAG